jgi:signal transduction histidine kinase
MIQRRNLQLAGELQEINSNLEATVAERTEKIQESNEQLHQLADQRAQLMANISHDMGSPLVGIQSHLKMMREEEATRDQRKFVVFDQMVTKLSYLKKMTDNLFDLSQLEAGAIDLQLEREKVADIIQNLQAEVRRIADATSMEVTFGHWFPVEHVWPEDEVLVDFHSLCRVVQNYMENAHKFSTATPCRIVIHGDVESVNGGLRELVFAVEDFGTGIAEDDLPHIFERFYKGKGQVKGGGLGLAIVKEIMGQHGGAVDVTSQFGQGSTFFFRLPVR